jgi:hypothetical protein
VLLILHLFFSFLPSFLPPEFRLSFLKSHPATIHNFTSDKIYPSLLNLRIASTHCGQSTPTMASYFSRLSPVPGFSPYTGPYKVGTVDVELPISELESPSPAPTEDIPTVQYRIFYPCVPDAKCKKSVHWLPAPQRGYVSAYTRFLGAGSLLADVIS